MIPLTCLITLQHRVDNPELWFSNGYSQNVKFLYDLLETMGHSPVFLFDTELETKQLIIRGRAYRSIQLSELRSEPRPVDLVLEAGVSVGEQDREMFRRRCAARIVSVRYGISLIFDMEQMLHAETMGPGIHIGGSDMVWTSPHIAYGESYLRTIYGCPSAIAPYIWEPDFVDVSFSQPDRRRVRDIYVMEPNLSVLKNALVPLAIIENVYRRDRGAFGKAMIVNATGFHERTHFRENIVRYFQSSRAESNKVYFTPRARFADAFQQQDVLLAHQWGCSLNYLYLEALHTGIPFVHNSPELQEGGFYYPDFDIEAGGEQCMRALLDNDVRTARPKHRALLHRFSINNSEVQRAYQSLLECAMSLQMAC